MLARPAGIEPATPWIGTKYAIHCATGAYEGLSSHLAYAKREDFLRLL